LGTTKNLKKRRPGATREVKGNCGEWKALALEDEGRIADGRVIREAHPPCSKEGDFKRNRF